MRKKTIIFIIAFAIMQKSASAAVQHKSASFLKNCWIFLGYADSKHQMTVPDPENPQARFRSRSLCFEENGSIQNGWDGGNFFDGSYKRGGGTLALFKNSIHLEIKRRTQMAGYNPLKESLFLKELREVEQAILLEGGARLALILSSGKEMLFMLSHPKLGVKTPISEIEGKFIGSGPWVFLGYSKNGLFEKEIATLRGVYLDEHCLIGENKMGENKNELMIADYSFQKISTALARNVLSPFYLFRFKILGKRTPSDEKRHERFQTALQQVIGIAEISESHVALQTSDGHKLEFIKAQGRYLDHLKTNGCSRVESIEAPLPPPLD